MLSKSSVRLFILLLGAFLTQLLTADDLVLADYSQTDGSSGIPGSFQGPFGTGSVVFDSSPVDSNNQVIKLQNYDDGTPDSWGIIHIKNFGTNQDISSYQQLQFSFYSEGEDSNRSVVIQLRFEPGNGSTISENNWNIKSDFQPSLSEAFSKWETVTIPLSEVFFERSSTYNGLNTFDLTTLKGIGVLVLNNDADASLLAEPPVFVDDIKATTTPSSLNVDTSTVNFGNLTPSPANFRYESEIVKLEYVASFTNAWEIRVYTSNPNDGMGLVNGDNNVLLKVDPGADDTASNDLDWSGDDNTEPKFFFVLDDDAKDQNENPFYTKIVSSANEDSAIDDGYEVNFAIDAAGAVPATYSANVIFELFVY